MHVIYHKNKQFTRKRVLQFIYLKIKKKKIEENTGRKIWKMKRRKRSRTL